MLCRRDAPTGTEKALDTRIFSMLDTLAEADPEMKREQNGVFSFTVSDGGYSLSGKTDSQGYLLLLEENGLSIEFSERR